MIIRKSLMVVLVVVVTVVAGCGREDQSLEPIGRDHVASEALIPPAALPDTTSPQREALANASHYGFKVVPSSMSACPETPAVVATVSWDVKESMPEGIRVEVAGSASEPRNVLTQNRSSGSVQTDAWVRAGTWFFLIDEQGERELAAFEVQGEPCAR